MVLVGCCLLSSSLTFEERTFCWDGPYKLKSATLHFDNNSPNARYMYIGRIRIEINIEEYWLKTEAIFFRLFALKRRNFKKKNIQKNKKLAAKSYLKKSPRSEFQK